MCLKATGGQIALIVQLPRVRYPFVNQNQARRVLIHQLTERVPRAGRFLVIRLNSLECLLRFFNSAGGKPKLPSQVHPKAFEPPSRPTW